MCENEGQGGTIRSAVMAFKCNVRKVMLVEGAGVANYILYYTHRRCASIALTACSCSMTLTLLSMSAMNVICCSRDWIVYTCRKHCRESQVVR